jgi:hypothetical protein
MLEKVRQLIEPNETTPSRAGSTWNNNKTGATVTRSLIAYDH